MTKKEIDFAIEFLNKIMPPWDYEANLYCASSFYGLGEYICTEPEGYVFKTAIEALEKQIRIKKELEYLRERDPYGIMLISDVVKLFEEVE